MSTPLKTWTTKPPAEIVKDMRAAVEKSKIDIGVSLQMSDYNPQLIESHRLALNRLLMLVEE